MAMIMVHLLPSLMLVAEPTACSQCHNMLMLLAVSKDMTDKERDIVIPLMMQVLLLRHSL